MTRVISSILSSIIGTALLVPTAAAEAPPDPTVAQAPPGSAVAQADAPLTWKLKKGDVFYAKAVNAMKQTVSVNGNKMNQEQNQTTYHKYTVKEAGKDGTVIEQTVMRSDVEGNLPGTADVAKKLKGVSLTFTLNAKNEVTKVASLQVSRWMQATNESALAP